MVPDLASASRWWAASSSRKPSRGADSSAALDVQSRWTKKKGTMPVSVIGAAAASGSTARVRRQQGRVQEGPGAGQRRPRVRRIRRHPGVHAVHPPVPPSLQGAENKLEWTCRTDRRHGPARTLPSRSRVGLGGKKVKRKRVLAKCEDIANVRICPGHGPGDQRAGRLQRGARQTPGLLPPPPAVVGAHGATTRVLPYRAPEYVRWRRDAGRTLRYFTSVRLCS